MVRYVPEISQPRNRRVNCNGSCSVNRVKTLHCPVKNTVIKSNVNEKQNEKLLEIFTRALSLILRICTPREKEVALAPYGTEIEVATWYCKKVKHFTGLEKTNALRTRKIFYRKFFFRFKSTNPCSIYSASILKIE